MADVNVTYQFIAGTKAQASQVNKNFSDCITAINQNQASINTLDSQVTQLQNSKANKNGSTTEVFNVADPASSYNAVNKRFLEEWTSLTSDYINGLLISRVSNTEISVSTGACLDSTKAVVLSLITPQTVSYESSLSANTTYDVFIRKSKSTQSVDCTILAHNSEPSSTDYYYRKLGEIKTNSSARISNITNYSNSQDQVGFPDYQHGISISSTGTGSGTASSDGWIYARIGQTGVHHARLNINNVEVGWSDHDSGTGGGGSSVMVPIKKGSSYSASGWDHLVFFPSL